MSSTHAYPEIPVDTTWPPAENLDQLYTPELKHRKLALAVMAGMIATAATVAASIVGNTVKGSTDNPNRTRMERIDHTQP
jgi:hypothetical protein